MKIIDVPALDQILDGLRSRGYTLLGPTIRDQAIVYDEIASTRNLPVGWKDEQSPGTYRLHRRDDDALFGYVVGPHAWKKFLFPPVQKLFHVTRNGQELRLNRPKPDAERRAFIGVRACEIEALSIQDQVFTGGPFSEPSYLARLRNMFVLAVNCGEPAATCFCTSMGAGPAVKCGFDLALTELIGSDRHEFIAESGSPEGEELLRDVRSREARSDDLRRRRELMDKAAHSMARSVETSDLKELLYRNQESARWDRIAERCLSCANCTMVCPTCFCSTVEDVTDLSGDHAERLRKWDSCFTMDFSYLVGGSVRSSTKARYRQWMTHKLATWQDQFRRIGCVGCGRCITWCPVGIDITEEVAAIRRGETTSAPTGPLEKSHDRYSTGMDE